MPIRILVVDDETDIRETVKDALQERGYEVNTADGCGPAERMLEEQEYDVVVTDKNMPDIIGDWEGGLRLLQTIKEKWPQTEVIVMTGYATVETAVESMKLGAFDYISKPFSLKALNEKIERVLEYRKFIHSEGALGTYRLLHRQILMLLENRANLPEADISKHLTTVGARIDHLFGSQKEWERVIRLQNDALERIEALATRLKSKTGRDDQTAPLLDEILEVASRRFLPP